MLTDKSIGIDTGSGNPTPVVNTGLERVRPQLLCVESGRVLTDKRLCGRLLRDIVTYSLHEGAFCPPKVTTFGGKMHRQTKWESSLELVLVARSPEDTG